MDNQGFKADAILHEAVARLRAAGQLEKRRTCA
jgi:hypothetical protein